jgi:polyhydroxyalkanoate synthase
MTNSQNEFWSRAGEEFQENLAKSWGQAMQTFQTMDLGGIVPPAQDAVPQLTFSQEKLKELQAAYLEEATALWNHGLESKHE